MKHISDSDFLAWAAEVGLVPDDTYRLSQQQLVFATAPGFWSIWDPPRAPGDLAKFVDSAISFVGEGPLRIRLRGGGEFSSVQDDSKPEVELRTAALSCGIPDGTSGALEFDPTERSALLGVAIAYLSFGYCLGTDLELVTSDRNACLMLSHHYELIAQFASNDRLRDFDKAMTAAGYGDQAEQVIEK